MSSPRGLVVGGMGDIGTGTDSVDDPGWGGGGGCCARVDVGRGSGGRGKRKEKGLYRNWERRGGLRTFRYMFNERKARLACGT
jgi:hypothetical protein